MIEVLLIVHLLLALAMIGVVLLQRSEGGALGIGGGGGGGGMSGFLTGRGTANLLTRATAILAALFISTSLILTILTGGSGESRSIVDELSTVPPSSEEAPPEPMGPTVPLQ